MSGGHQIGAAIVAVAAGVVRDQLGDYAAAWSGAGALCLVAAVPSARIRRGPVPEPA
jgi:fucose permease